MFAFVDTSQRVADQWALTFYTFRPSGNFFQGPLVAGYAVAQLRHRATSQKGVGFIPVRV